MEKRKLPRGRYFLWLDPYSTPVRLYNQGALSQHECTAQRPKSKSCSTLPVLTRTFARTCINWWHTFINSWNGVSFLRLSHLQTTFDYHIQTDASGSWGCGAFFSTQWFQFPWSTEWSTENIMAKELVPIVVSCAIWGPILARKRTEFHEEFQCDNQSLVSAINKGSAKDSTVMHLLRCLWFFTALFNIDIMTTHIAGAIASR